MTVMLRARFAGLLGVILAGFAAGVEAEGGHSVRLLEPPIGLHTGALRVGAVVEGEGVARVEFLLDGKVVMSKIRPPYGVEVHLGDTLRPRRVTAIALTAAGEELARDTLEINLGPFRFAVRLIEPVPKTVYGSSVPVRAEVTLPVGDRLDRVDFLLEETIIDSATAPPYRGELALSGTGEPTYVRAIAYLEDGSSAEDLVFINSSRDMANLKVSFVELYTTVLDRRNQPIDDLEIADFKVFEDGAQHSIRRFERVLDRQVNLGILLDTSLSMVEELRETQKVAAGFLERLLRPQDRATVITFSDEAEVKVPFSNDVEALTKGLERLEALGETTLWDSLAFTLYYFGGLKGKRALVVLTDGQDSRSHYKINDVIEYAQRLGVAVYPIAVSNSGASIDRHAQESERNLRKLASATGGSSFSIQRASGIERAYERIEAELRAQYLVGYQSSKTTPGAFRQVKVEILGRGLKARTIPGYYP